MTPETLPHILLRHAAAVLICAGFLVPAARADDLDALLAQPPSASLTAEDAARRIEMLRALIPGHPDRADEIEAYLIPFVRVTQPPPAEPTPQPTPPPAQARPLLVLVQPNGSASTLKVASFRKQGAVIMATMPSGSRAVLQALTMVGQLPWYAEEELASGAVDLNALAASYDTFARAVPGLRHELGGEAARFRAMQKARDDAAAGKETAARARLAAATEAVYEPSAGYTAATLAKLLLAAEKARGEMPESAAKIDEWAAPFREHFMKLLSGQAFIDGAWVSTEELAREAREKRQAEFLKSLDYQLGREPFPAGALRGELARPALEALLAFAAGGALVFFGRRKKGLLVAGAALVALSPLAFALVLFLATRNPAQLPPEMAVSGDDGIVEALSEAAGLENGPTPHKIPEDALNSFLARHVRIAGAAPGGDARQALAVRLFPGRVAIFEMVRSLGLSWIVRLDLEFRKADGQPALVPVGAKIGRLDASGKFAAALWGGLQPELGGILADSRVSEQFAIQSPAAGSVELLPAGGRR